MPFKRKTKKKIELSVIIVNYNVKDFLRHALISIQKAMKGINGEIIVVDNASDDGSVEMLRQHFPKIHLIANKVNLGFAKANNLALSRARGKYLLLLNPDTIVQEDTFNVMIRFFEEGRDVGLAGCKILNPDGSFQLACRRSFPTPWVAFTKILGLSTLFPKTKLFGKYNLTYLSQDETYEIDAVSGSFMMVSREVYESVGGLDEDFFMYGEDLDWCYRIQRAGWKIYYVHSTKIIHYKGESTSRSNIDEIRTFYEAMHLFVKKHINQFWISTFILRLSISFSAWIAMLKELLRPLRIGFIDLIIINLSIILSEFLWLGTLFYFPSYGYPIVFSVPAVITIASLYATGVYTHHRMSVTRTFLGVIISYVIIAAFVAFFKQYAFSRMVILLSGVFSALLLPGWRLMYRLWGRQKIEGSKRLLGRRTLIVGTDGSALELHRRLRSRIGNGYEVIGYIDTTRKKVGKNISGIPILGSLDNIGKVIQEHNINDVIFSTARLSYSNILSVISRTGNRLVNYHLVPNTMEVIIGKGSIDTLDDLPLVEINYNVDRPINKISKRIFDFCVATLLLISIYPFVYWKLKGNPEKIRKSFILGLPAVIKGDRSLVGPPEARDSHRNGVSSRSTSPYIGKIGLTGIVQLSRDRTLSDKEQDQFNLYYARNQSLSLDLEILLKSLLSYRERDSVAYQAINKDGKAVRGRSKRRVMK